MELRNIKLELLTAIQAVQDWWSKSGRHEEDTITFIRDGEEFSFNIEGMTIFCGKYEDAEISDKLILGIEFDIQDTKDFMTSPKKKVRLLKNLLKNLDTLETNINIIDNIYKEEDKRWMITENN